MRATTDAPASGRRWQVLLGTGITLAALYVIVDYGAFASSVYVGVTATAAIAVGIAVRRRQLYRPAAWTLLACGLALAATGHSIWYWLDLRGLEPFPSIADAFYLAVYPLFVVALWLLGRRRGEADGAVSDALILGTSATVLAWAVLIAPYLQDDSLTTGQLLVSAAYPVADLLLFPLLLHLVFAHTARMGAYLFLLLGMVAYLAADVLYAHGNATGWYDPGGMTDGAWLVAYVLFVAAAWHPTAAAEPPSVRSAPRLSGQRLVVLGAAAVLAPAVILMTAGTDVALVRIAAIASIVLFLLIMGRMAGLATQTRRQAEVLEELSLTDPLTGAANRRYLEHELDREISRAGRTSASLCLVFLDLDHFKRFNDDFGHRAGDELLQDLVAAWHEVLRPVDVLARYGGEEFVAVFSDVDLDGCRMVVERLRALVPHEQTCSAGVASFMRGDTAKDLIDRADRALYQAKHRGRNQVVVAEPVPS